MFIVKLKRLSVTLLAFFLVIGAHVSQAEGLTELYQSDFVHGTYIIDEPGIYRLAEDISFNPNSTALLETDAYHAGFPLPRPGPHPPYLGQCLAASPGGARL